MIYLLDRMIEGFYKNGSFEEGQGAYYKRFIEQLPEVEKSSLDKLWLQKVVPLWREWISTWLELGNKNPWIVEAVDPPFNAASFYDCNTLLELAAFFRHGNWSLGTAFAYANFCFINQINGGSEWLVIRNDLAFESFSTRLMLESGSFLDTMKSIIRATPEQLSTWSY